MEIKSKHIAFVVRITIIMLALYSLAETYYAFKNTQLYEYSIFGNALMTNIVLFLSVFNNKSYHCKYMRLLTLNLIITSLINYIDDKWGFFSFLYDYGIYGLQLVMIFWSITIIGLLYLTINHFRTAVKERN